MRSGSVKSNLWLIINLLLVLQQHGVRWTIKCEKKTNGSNPVKNPINATKEELRPGATEYDLKP